MINYHKFWAEAYKFTIYNNINRFVFADEVPISNDSVDMTWSSAVTDELDQEYGDNIESESDPKCELQ